MMKNLLLVGLTAFIFGALPSMAEKNGLPEQIHRKITALSEEGDSLAEDSKYSEAIFKYQKAI